MLSILHLKQGKTWKDLKKYERIRSPTRPLLILASSLDYLHSFIPWKHSVRVREAHRLVCAMQCLNSNIPQHVLTCTVLNNSCKKVCPESKAGKGLASCQKSGMYFLSSIHIFQVQEVLLQQKKHSKLWPACAASAAATLVGIGPSSGQQELGLLKICQTIETMEIMLKLVQACADYISIISIGMGGNYDVLRWFYEHLWTPLLVIAGVQL